MEVKRHDSHEKNSHFPFSIIVFCRCTATEMIQCTFFRLNKFNQRE